MSDACTKQFIGKHVSFLLLWLLRNWHQELVSDGASSQPVQNQAWPDRPSINTRFVSAVDPNIVWYRTTLDKLICISC
jgi:hypothetical protein